MYDVFDRPVYKDDIVAHVTRQSSHIYWKRGRVIEVEHDRVRVKWSGSEFYVPANPTWIAKNFVKIGNLHETL